MDDLEREEAVCALVQAYLQDASAWQWHVYAARSNYDGHSRSVQWLADNPELDRGTALLLHWYLGAAGFVQYDDEAAVPDFLRSDFRRVRLIEARLLGGFYRHARIRFDPMASEGGGPAEIRASRVRRPVPAELLSPSPGEALDLDPPGYDEGIPLELADRIHALFEE